MSHCWLLVLLGLGSFREGLFVSSSLGYIVVSIEVLFILNVPCSISTGCNFFGASVWLAGWSNIGASNRVQYFAVPAAGATQSDFLLSVAKDDLIGNDAQSTG